MFQLTTRTTPKMASFAAKLCFPPVPTGLVGQSIKCLLFPLSPYSLLYSATHLSPTPKPIISILLSQLYNIFARLSRWHLLAFPCLNPVNTSTGPTPFSARRLEPDWIISAAISDGRSPGLAAYCPGNGQSRYGKWRPHMSTRWDAYCMSCCKFMELLKKKGEAVPK